VKKNRLEFLKNWSVWFGFGFINLKLKKPNRTQTEKKSSQTRKTEPNKKQSSQTEKTCFYSKVTEQKPVGLNWFWFFWKKIKLIWLFFLIKTESNWKWSLVIVLTNTSAIAICKQFFLFFLFIHPTLRVGYWFN
jgi:hypothetical protein